MSQLLKFVPLCKKFDTDAVHRLVQGVLCFDSFPVIMILFRCCQKRMITRQLKKLVLPMRKGFLSLKYNLHL